MSDVQSSVAEAAPPHAQMVQMAMAHWVSRIVYLAAKLNLADRLAGGPRSADELAEPTGTHAPSLYRFMRTLSNLGVLTEDAQHRFALTPIGASLKSDAPERTKNAVLTVASDWWHRGFGELEHSVRTGESGFVKTLGMPIFDFLAKNPEEASRFSDTMVCFHGMEPAAVAAAYDFSSVGTLIDVGGATGHLLATILQRYPTPRGILYDLPHVVRDAPAFLKMSGVADRIQIQAGSFFDNVPSGGDAYLLSHIIHDWSEEQCLTILANCKRAMGPKSRLLLVEMVLPEGDTPHPGKMLDLMMLVGPGGMERTEKGYGELLAKAGLELTRVVPTASPVSVVESVLA
jgi:hypothetical protein